MNESVIPSITEFGKSYLSCVCSLWKFVGSGHWNRQLKLWGNCKSISITMNSLVKHGAGLAKPSTSSSYVRKFVGHSAGSWRSDVPGHWRSNYQHWSKPIGIRKTYLRSAHSLTWRPRGLQPQTNEAWYLRSVPFQWWWSTCTATAKLWSQLLITFLRRAPRDGPQLNVILTSTTLHSVVLTALLRPINQRREKNFQLNCPPRLASPQSMFCSEVSAVVVQSPTKDVLVCFLGCSFSSTAPIEPRLWQFLAFRWW